MILARWTRSGSRASRLVIGYRDYAVKLVRRGGGGDIEKGENRERSVLTLLINI